MHLYHFTVQMHAKTRLNKASVIVCVYYREPRAGSSIPQWWALGPEAHNVHWLYAARPGGAGRGRSDRKQYDRWTWWRAYEWITRNGSLERPSRGWRTVERGGQWRYMWWVSQTNDASSSLGTHHTTVTPEAADSWAEQQTEKETNK